MKYILIIFTLLSIACNSNKDSINDCVDLNQELEGTYIIYSEMDTSEVAINFVSNEGEFQTNGLSGSKFWFPASPLSGQLHNCDSDYSDIMLTEYTDVERVGLASQGGFPRSYFESMSGYGEFYPNSDSIFLYVNYKRTGDFFAEFIGNLYLKKLP